MNYFAASCEVSLRANSYRIIHPRSKLTGHSGSIINCRGGGIRHTRSECGQVVKLANTLALGASA